MSVMELSHRSKTYEAVHNQAIERLRKLYAIPDDYEVLFVQGGASLQFSMIPMNFLPEGKKAGYVMTGSWSEKALKETKFFGGEAYEIASSKVDQYRYIPQVSANDLNADDAYVHITSNNTIYGTQMRTYPETGNVPLIADMSSDVMSKPIDISQFD